MRLSGFLAVLVLTLMALSDPAYAASPESVTLTPASPTTNFSSALIAGFGNDGTICVENVSCDTMVLIIAAGDYTGKNLKVSANWLVPANDFDLYAFQDRRGGPVVASSHSAPPGTHEEFFISLNGVLAAPKRITINMVCSAGGPEQTVQVLR